MRQCTSIWSFVSWVVSWLAGWLVSWSVGWSVQWPKTLSRMQIFCFFLFSLLKLLYFRSMECFLLRLGWSPSYICDHRGFYSANGSCTTSYNPETPKDFCRITLLFTFIFLYSVATVLVLGSGWYPFCIFGFFLLSFDYFPIGWIYLLVFTFIILEITH